MTPFSELKSIVEAADSVYVFEPAQVSGEPKKSRIVLQGSDEVILETPRWTTDAIRTCLWHFIKANKVPAANVEYSRDGFYFLHVRTRP